MDDDDDIHEADDRRGDMFMFFRMTALAALVSELLPPPLARFFILRVAP